MPAPDPFDRFVSAVHRRAIALAVIERVGICLAAAAGAACVLATIAGFRGMPAWPIVIAFVVVAVLVGATWGAIRRPSRLTAVMQADQQLKLADLLSSALIPSRDDFGQAVRAMAQRACARHSPSEVVLHRLGVRAWGGIGLAWAMVMVLSLLAGNGANTRAGSGVVLPQDLSRLNEGSPASLAGAPRGSGGSEASSDNFSHMGSPQDSQASGAIRSIKGDHATPADTSGELAAQSKMAGPDRVAAPRSSDANVPTDSQGDLADGNSARATNDATSAKAVGSADANGNVAAQSNQHAAAPWSTDRWPADRATALQQVQDGRVPAAYQDLVRDYFTPPAARPGD